MTGSPRIGIDLGTTHSALAWLAEDGDARVEMLDVPTVTAPGTIGAAPLLASFLYLPNANEFANGDLTLPWGEDRASLVGELARERGGQTPLRLVSSAKSWLSHAASDRRGAILPVEAAEDVTRVSPVEASTRYLTHLARAWDAAHPEAPIRNANVVLTVPASFDPVARELTAEAATKAGIESLTLLEEPQAALYAWIERMGDGWREHLSVGDLVLVIDVGGGTTDFSLIAIEEEDGQLAPRRVAVGDHILL
ncbi:MAG: Hsp70 family protein, partial [Myxococcales bacterium]|nr:Hsp70 family protein [Myxococcales bacterium]